jgi:hypothetical protein
MEAVGLRGPSADPLAPGMWQLPEAQRDLVPLMYSLLATKG